jgi:glycosyltransferase involved in cell wall biosynthesis
MARIEAFGAGERRPLVYMIPSWEAAKWNPYTAIVADELTRLGWQVRSPRRRDGFAEVAAIVHVHWPERAVVQGLLRSTLAALAWLCFFGLQKLRGARLVWTTHNVGSHRRTNPRLERLYMGAFTRLLDGIISMSAHNRARIVDKLPHLAGVPHAIVPHFVYGERYPPPPSPLPSSDRKNEQQTVAFLGDIRRYKGLHCLLSALAHSAPNGLRYVIQGKCFDVHYHDELVQSVSDLQAAGWDISWRAERMSNRELADSLDEVDLLVLPYLRADNSGLAVLAAERGVPMLLSGVPAFLDLADELGPGRAVVASGQWTVGDIQAALVRTKAARRRPPECFFKRRSQAATVAEMAGLYRRLLGRQERMVKTRLPW